MKKSIQTKMSLVQKYIELYINENGYSPSYREIANGVNIKSTASVKDYIDKLREAGRLKETAPGITRALVINRRRNGTDDREK